MPRITDQDRLKNMVRYAIPEPNTRGVVFGSILAECLQKIWPDARVIQKNDDDFKADLERRASVPFSNSVYRVEALHQIHPDGTVDGYRTTLVPKQSAFVTALTALEPHQTRQYLILEVPDAAHGGGSANLYSDVVGDGDFARTMLATFEKHYAPQGKKTGFKQNIAELSGIEEARYRELLRDGLLNLTGENLIEFEDLIARRDAVAHNKLATGFKQNIAELSGIEEARYRDKIDARYREALDTFKEGLAQFMAIPMLVDIDKAAARLPHEETIEYDGPLGGRNSKQCPVQLMTAGNLREFSDSLIEGNNEYLCEQEAGILRHIVDDQGYSESIAEAMHETLNVSDEALRAELETYAEQICVEQGGYIHLVPEGQTHLVFDPQIDINFDGITSSPFNAILDDGEFFRMLDVLRVPPNSWADHLLKQASDDSTGALDDYIAPLRAEQADNPTRWAFTDPPMISCGALHELLLNASYSGNLVFATQLDWDTLQLLSNEVYASGAQGALQKLAVKDTTVHLHNCGVGAGHYVQAQAPLMLLANVAGAPNKLVPLYTGEPDGFDQWANHFAASSGEIVTLNNDYALSYGIGAVFGEYPAADSSILYKPFEKPTKDHNNIVPPNDKPVSLAPSPY